MNAKICQHLGLGINTGLKDRHGRQIRLGHHVKNTDGLTGKIVFINGAVRVAYDAYACGLLSYNSSLLYSDQGRPCRFEIIDKN